MNKICSWVALATVVVLCCIGVAGGIAFVILVFTKFFEPLVGS